jgi:hypothetical protein
LLVRPPSPGERLGLAQPGPAATETVAAADELVSDVPQRHVGIEKSDMGRLLKVLQHQEADRVPFLELEITSRAVYEYVLEHEVVYEPTSARLGAQTVRPEDHIEFALRLGMDAVPCSFFWHPELVAWDDLSRPPALTDQLSYLERYLRASQGTHVGVIVSFSSFLDRALLAAGIAHDPEQLRGGKRRLEQVMDLILGNQEKVMRVVCDRFSDDLALVVIRDNIAHEAGLVLPIDLFMEVFPQRMERLIAPAKEHGKLLIMHSSGQVDQFLPLLYDLGFDAIHPVEAEFNDIFDIKKRWTEKLAIIGNVPTTLLARASTRDIEEVVRDYCIRLAPGGGYVLSSSGPISDDIPPANLVAMIRAVQRHGRFGSLGQGADRAAAHQEQSRI